MQRLKISVGLVLAGSLIAGVFAKGGEPEGFRDEMDLASSASGLFTVPASSILGTGSAARLPSPSLAERQTRGISAP